MESALGALRVVPSKNVTNVNTFHRRARRGTRDLRPDPARVVLIYRSVPHYRVPFYEQLRTRLEGLGIEFVLVYGEASGSAARRLDTARLSWGNEIRNRILRLPGRRELFWQPCSPFIRRGDLVIVEQASKLLINYLLVAAQQLGYLRLAFWGHGRNFQTHSASAIGEYIKRRLSTRCHWWFAYNELSAEAVEALGYPRERITSVNNTIDTGALLRARRATTAEEVLALRTKLRLQGEHVAIYSGSLYEEKRLPFLIAAASAIREKVPDFELLVLGAGPDEGLIRSAAREHPWIRYVGPVFGQQTVPYFLLSQVLLMPGLVGLAVIDAFANQVPLITVDLPLHSPEIQYLADDVNGLLLPAGTTPEGYARTTAALLVDDKRLARLRAGCEEAASVWTMERMVENFADGIRRALSQ